VPSWRFKETGGDWPFIQIVAPADVRLVTRPADATQVPRPGEIEVVAKLFGSTAHPVMLSVDDADPQPMVPTSGTALWTARVVLEAGLHRIVASVGTDRDTVAILVRSECDVPRRGMPVAPGRDIHSIGAWPDHGIAGTQLGPNKNGKHW
jgi:Icc protein